ncbi:MAG: ubiquinone/menaquinone biosynthesis methyltransferase [Candidatus Dormibacteraeota bacterium]|nr:ubiquinone/menaquinone biosynthesis methyltransferase [Candidatus Dormibacteraeota bacterium]
MFDRVAGRYDLVNTILSGGSDARWRRRTGRAAGLELGGRALDVACGSGKLSRELLRTAAADGLVVGLDFSEGMLEVARCGGHGPAFVRGDALDLPFPDGIFDAVTIAFGLRNLAGQERGLREMARVLRPGGRGLVLEFVRPARGPVGSLYRAYLRHGLPRIGGLVSGQPQAYRYLSDTVDAYHSPEELVELAVRAGWQEPRIELLTFGTVGLLSGRR